MTSLIMNSARYERMIGIPEDEYMHLKSLQQVHNPLQQKFQTLSNEYNQQEVISDPFVRNQRQGETLNSMIQLKDDIRQQLVQVTPKPYQSRADNLFNFISNKLMINERGEIMGSNGKVVEGSNIADLVQHAVRDRRRNIIPPGWETFRDILKKSNAPRMILNYETLEEMQGVPSPSPVKRLNISRIPTPIKSKSKPKRSNSLPDIKPELKQQFSRKRQNPPYLDDYLLNYSEGSSRKKLKAKRKDAN